MKTACPTCRAPVQQRVHLSAPGYPDASAPLPLFAETYTCGAVHLYGQIEGDGVARTCPKAPVQLAYPGRNITFAIGSDGFEAETDAPEEWTPEDWSNLALAMLRTAQLHSGELPLLDDEVLAALTRRSTS